MPSSIPSFILTHDACEDGTEEPRHDNETDFGPFDAAELMLDEGEAENSADYGMSAGNRKFGVRREKLPKRRS